MLKFNRGLELGRSGARRSRLIQMVFLASLLVAQVTLAATQVRTLGGSGCDFTDLQAAVDFMKTQAAADRKIIRIASDMAYTDVAVTIEDLSLTLAGGYESCSDSEPSGTFAVLEGNQVDPVVYATSSGGRQEVTLRNLHIARGGGGQGGGLLVEGNILVRAEAVSFISNSASLGGGVALLEGANITMEGVSMLGNFASDFGGAIYCQEGAITGVGNNSFRNNLGGKAGGAIFLTEACRGTFVGAHSFWENTAESGGALVSQGSTTFHRSSGDGRAVFRRNRAIATPPLASYGGAIFQGAGDLTLQDAVFEDNQSTGGIYGCGGAVAVIGSGSKWHLESTTRSCLDSPCSIFRNNKAQLGAAFCLSSGEATFSGAHFEGHSDIDGSPAGSLFYLGDLGPADLRVEGSMIVANSAGVIFRKLDVGDLSIGYSTIAENLNVSTVINAPGPTAAQEHGGDGRVDIYSTILWEDPATNLMTGDSPVTTECLLLSETMTLPLPSHWLNSDPGFLDPSSNDYRLGAGSPAVDFCPPGAHSAPGRDIDQGLRPYDAPLSPNAGAGRIYDVGADELGSDGFLLEDDFESGDTSAWSQPAI